MERILVINLGSTSSKIAVFDDETQIFVEVIRHSTEDMAQFKEIMDQLDYRIKAIEDSLAKANIDPKSLTCIVSRGGMLPAAPLGSYYLDQAMADYLKSLRIGVHISNASCVIGYMLSQQYGIPGYTADPVTADELSPLSRITGIPELPKESLGHALNTHAMARRCAQEELNKPLDECNLIVAHLGGGCSVWMYEKGVPVDMFCDDNGPMSPERSGRVNMVGLVKLCYSGKHTEGQMAKKIRGEGGLKAWFGTSDAREIEERAINGDEQAALVYEAIAYTVSKCIGDLATVTKGKVDRIVITGGLAYSDMIVNWIRDRVEWIAPIYLFPGEFEIEALAETGLRIQRGQETPRYFDPNMISDLYRK